MIFRLINYCLRTTDLLYPTVFKEVLLNYLLEIGGVIDKKTFFFVRSRVTKHGVEYNNNKTVTISEP